jgi:hypothetical protein
MAAYVAMAIKSKMCLVCGNVLPITGPRASPSRKYCSDECRERAWGGPSPIRTSGLDLAPSTVGALSELIIASDLLRRHYEVFRSVSPSCSCDLIALRNGVSLRIEVRTGSVIYGNGGHTVRWTRDRFHADAFAVVVYEPDGTTRIQYEPPLESAQEAA